MCRWMDKVVDGVEVYQVGKQQLWDWCAYNGREFTGWLPEHQSVHSYADSLRKGIYLVVEVCATFGRLGDVQLAQSYTSLKSAVKMARAYDDAMTACVLVRGGRLAYGYEVWHVVDDAELWFSEQGYAADERVEQERIDAQLDAWDCDFDVLESLRQLREAGAIA